VPKFASAALAIMLWPVAAGASDPTVKDLYDWCNSEPGTTGNLDCELYMRGFVEGIKDSGSRNSCLPEAFTATTFRALFLQEEKSLRQSPSGCKTCQLYLSYPASEGVAMIYMGHFWFRESNRGIGQKPLVSLCFPTLFPKQD